MRRYCHPEFRGRELYQEVDFVVISVVIAPSSPAVRKRWLTGPFSVLFVRLSLWPS